MPNFYNTAAPTSSSKNTINDIAVTFGIRDFLLNKNLQPVYPGAMSVSPGNQKIGEPVLDTMIGTGNVVIPNGLPLETEGILRWDIATVNNKFKNNSSTASDLTNIDDILVIKNINWPSIIWPNGLEYPIGNNNSITENGIAAKTTVALFRDGTVSKNQFKTSSTIPNDLVSTITDKIKFPFWPSSIWPDGSTYPSGGSNINVENFGINSKTTEARFRENNLNKNERHSSIGNTLVSIEYLEKDNFKDFPTNKETKDLLFINEYAKYRKNNTIKNLYLDTTKQVDVSSFIDYQPLDISQQITGYLDNYGALNLGGSKGIRAANIIGSVLNGQGLGLAKGGVVTNFDLRSSLAGRVLGATGLINDTKLGMIGGQQLALSLANNAAFNLEQDLLGRFNVQDNVLSLIKTGSFTKGFFRPNYKITIPSSDLGKVGDYTSRILGFTLPKSYLDDAGSIFQSENGDIGNIDRANKMLLNTGNGQLTALIANIVSNINGTGTGNDSPEKTKFRSGYAPGYQDHDGVTQINGNQIYAFGKEGKPYGLLTSSDGIIPDLSYTRRGRVEDSGFDSPRNVIGDTYTSSNIKNPTFSWGSKEDGTLNSFGDYNSFFGEKKSLLSKTQTLFNSKGMLNIVSVKGASNIEASQIQTAVYNNMISKGSGVLSEDNFDLKTGKLKSNPNGTPDNTFCRSWTTFNRYEKLQNLIRKSGLSNLTPYRNQIEGSILDDNGFPKIAPYITDNPADPKKFMFSIENLAWNDNVNDLSQEERGPGDLVTGKKGRIMWFPPYDIKFTENSSVNWESTNFIGRGESIYSYNNTERAGTLSFKIVVDHSTYTNTFRGTNGPFDQYINSFMAGCVNINSEFSKKLTVSEMSFAVNDLVSETEKVNLEAGTPPITKDIYVYFPNDVYDVNLYPNYEDLVYPLTKGKGVGDVTGQLTHIITNDIDNYGLNNGLNLIKIDNDNKFYGYKNKATGLPLLDTYLQAKCPFCKITVEGYASVQGNSKEVNNELAIKRAESVKEDLKKYLFTNLKGEELNKRFLSNGNGVDTVTAKDCQNATDLNKAFSTNNISCKKGRYVIIHIEDDSTLAANTLAKPSPVVKKPLKRLNTKIENKFYSESNYFEKLTLADSFVFDKFREKIRYFHPAFHSTTPEGLNSRLTFLNQCTRQGPTLEDQGATNLAFGRAPVCILRIGDFYNTKIVIDSLGIDYEPLQWDLNPEGIGVQPMIANVDISFKFIGGSTLMGPINK